MSIEFRAAPPYRVLVDGAEIIAHDDHAAAMQDAYAAAATALPSQTVEFVGGTGIQIIVQAATQPPVEPEPEIPDPEPEQPEEPAEPEEPVDPDPEDPPPVEYQGDHPFFALAAGMEKGEFRRVSRIPGVEIKFPEGVANQRLMHFTNWFSGTKDATIGRGWTDRSVFDPLTGRCYEVYCREQYETSIVWMNPDLSWDGIPAPPEAGIGGRRPFDRLCRLGEYLYWLPNMPREDAGRITRCHVTTPHIWEDAGAPKFPFSVSTNFNGDCSMTVHEETGRFVVHISAMGRGDTSPEGIWDYEYGRMLSWAPGDSEWRLETRTQSSGHVGVATYNPVHREVLTWGGSVAYDRPHKLGGQCLTTYDAEGVAHRHGPCGLFASAASRRLGVHPQTGDYILLDRILVDNPQNNHDGPIRIWIGDPTRGREFRLMHLLPRGDVFSLWEEYHPPVMLWGTDLIVWMDLERGPIIHRLYTWEELEGAEFIPIPQRGQLADPVDDDDDDPDEKPAEPAPPVIVIPDPPPPFEGEFPSVAGTQLARLIEQCAPGRIMRLDAATPAGLPWADFVVQNTLNPAVPCMRDHPTWGSKAHWDRIRLRLFHLGERTPLNTPLKMHFASYLAAEHAWIHNPLDPRQPGKAHPYGQQALDDIGGYYYYDPGHTEIRRLHIDSGTWEFIPVLQNGAEHVGQSPVCWHERMGMLVTVDGNKRGKHMRGWREGSDRWLDLGEIDHDGYHAHGRYSRVRGDMLILGGNHNANRVTIIDAQGVAHRMKDKPSEIDGIPFSTGMAQTNLSDCPVTGNYLLWDMRQRVLWEYNPDKDVWAIARDWNAARGSAIADDWPGSYYGHPAAPIAGTDALLWFSGHLPRIYRHAPVI